VFCHDCSTSKAKLIALAVSLGLAAALPAAPAAAAGLLDFLFGGLKQLAPQLPFPAPPQALPRAEPQATRQSESVQGGSGGPSSGYCVRLCDGRYFPVEGHRNASAVDQCRSSCPATATKVFSGSGIDHAVASDGTRYSDLPNAFVYRKQYVASCTCNGRTNYGLAYMPATDDPTLRPGDVIATNSGFAVYSGRGQNQQAFTPIESAGVSRSLRAQLADVKIAPRPDATPASETTGQGAQATPARGNPRQISATER
jgi:hypothetical protein